MSFDSLISTYLTRLFDLFPLRLEGVETLTLFRMGFFGAAHVWGGRKGPPL